MEANEIMTLLRYLISFYFWTEFKVRTFFLSFSLSYFPSLLLILLLSPFTLTLSSILSYLFIFLPLFIPALGPTQPPMQWVPGALSLGVKRPGREADRSPPSSSEVKE
jgi:hypothetical protein